MSHQVTVKDTGRVFTVNDGEMVLDAALRQQIALPYGCQTGGCGACRARLLSGKARHLEDPLALSLHEIRQGYILLCQSQADSDLTLQVEELPGQHAIRVRNLPVRVARREQLCHDVMALFLQLPKGEAFEFLAGQYIDILLPDGRRRSFSLASAPVAGGQLELHLRLVPGGQFTDYVFNQMPDRALLRIEGPLGGFYLRDTDRPAILVGGGTGFAPLKGMLEEAFSRRLSRPLHLYWGVRARRDLYMDSEVRQWQKSRPNFRYIPVLSEPAAEDSWNGRTGFVHEAVAQDHADLSHHEVYMSGPPPMIEAGKTRFTELGLPPDHLHYDSFDYAYQTWPAKG